jgi:hypothetical protein
MNKNEFQEDESIEELLSSIKNIAYPEDIIDLNRPISKEKIQAGTHASEGNSESDALSISSQEFLSLKSADETKKAFSIFEKALKEGQNNWAFSQPDDQTNDPASCPDQTLKSFLSNIIAPILNQWIQHNQELVSQLIASHIQEYLPVLLRQWLDQRLPSLVTQCVEQQLQNLKKNHR